MVWTEEVHRPTCRDPGKASGKVFERRPLKNYCSEVSGPRVTAGVGVGVMVYTPPPQHSPTLLPGVSERATI